MLYPIELESGNKSLQRSRQPGTSSMNEVVRTASSDDIAVPFRRFLAGDDSAFHTLYKIHNQRIYAYCSKILRDAEAAKDVTHSLWEKVIALREKEPNILNPAGFLLRMARNLCLDHQKHHRFQKPLEELTESEHRNLTDTELTSDEGYVVEALLQLPEAAKEIIVLHYYSGYSFEEIAEMLGKSPNAIWTRVSRARNDLKNIITKRMKAEHTTERNTHGR
ncbi:MAG: RNA polymerase sigma factor [Bacteroidota bacterium]|nr:RNA polymerase sigma factor [Bacteroidota bacterium]MDP4235762.1 RNA polymerase sigma factor [Bacteroidota bacterium]